MNINDEAVVSLLEAYNKQIIDKVKPDSCPHCEFLSKTFCNAPDSTDREYWLMTEVFVYLHKGKDVCNYPLI